MHPLNQFAKTKLGINYLYPKQILVIHQLIESFKSRNNDEAINNHIYVMPTGAGKSLCFTLPGLICHTQTLIILPIRALVEDQHRRLREQGLDVVKIMGRVDKDLIKEQFNKLSPNGFILATPESLLNPQFDYIIQSHKIGFMICDEAHTISQWGLTFRPTLLELGKIRSKMTMAVCGAFTATATPQVQQDIKKHLFNDHSAIELLSSPLRDNLRLFYIKVLDPLVSLYHLLNKTPIVSISKEDQTLILYLTNSCILIFVSTRNTAEILCHQIRKRYPERDVFYYHAGLEIDQKKHIEKEYMISTNAILVATCAYGLGIDKKDIGLVIHYQEPEDPESYLQEAGRAGRNGDTAASVVFVQSCKKESFLHQKKCRYETLMEYFDHTLSYCPGCDICHSSHSKKSYSLKAVQLIHRYYHYDSIKETSKWLKGLRSLHNPYSPFIPGYGHLKHWVMDDIISISDKKFNSKIRRDKDYYYP
ncbi:DEAD/DEAH box helicase [Spirochaeta cellobiosiphila]|uniref:DEAD/DEAH box helicase n=1 Tax=Spirochaeta cellobiosiphila TaxID=504483 RepID=UPI0004196CA6|nr:DEAD/DEAH box helicase [Spirochaeta cellobiosiphila]